MKNETETSGHRPDKLDVRRFAREKASLQGEISLADLARLRQDAFGLDEAELTALMVRWRAQGIWLELRGGAAQTRVRLQADVIIPLQCQRCLDVVDHALSVDREFLFVADEATAMKLDDESEEDVLVANKSFDLLELIEDELLMGLPLVARHEQCSNLLPQEFEAEFDDSEAQADEFQDRPANPFAVLGSIKKH